MHADDRPIWAKRIRAERAARGWSQPDAVNAMRAHSRTELPGNGSLLRNWKRWEAGEVEPDDFNKKLIAKAFGTVSAAIFPMQSRRDAESELLAGSGLDTLEVLSRIRASDVSPATLDALRITANRLCCEYPYMPSGQLRVEGRAWLHRITSLLNGRMTLAQHREVLSLAGLVALLLGCVEYDMGLRRDAEVTRQAALSLGEESEQLDVLGWAHEMRAWYALTQGNYEGAVTAGRTGEEAASGRSVAVQLAAQQAKAWARMGDRRQMELALERGRNLLEVLPTPEDTEHHFVVDPAKFDFYAMDCYRITGEDKLAEMYSREVMRTSTNFDGSAKAPMRVAEANITLGVVSARRGDLEQAVSFGQDALVGDRRSMPSLLMVSKELASTLTTKYPNESATTDYIEQLKTVANEATQ